MKRWFAILLMTFASCSWEDGVKTIDKPLTQAGFVTMDVTGQNDDDPSDDIRSVRFIVLGDLDTYPHVELNELHPVATNGAGALTAVLELTATDKRVIAIANEPDTLKTVLGSVSSLRQLEEMELKLGSIAFQSELKATSGMPMTGSVRVSAADMRETVDAAKRNPVAISLDRHLARVDVYMTTDNAQGMELLAGSTVTLDGVCAQSSFMPRNPLLPADRLEKRTWSGTARIPAEGTDPVLVHSFLTSERLCGNDKPVVEIDLETPYGHKSASVTLDIEAVERNHRYIVKGRVSGKISLGVEVVEWNEALERFPLGQYHLVLDRSALTFHSSGGTQTIAVDSDHPDGWHTEMVPAELTVTANANVISVTVPPRTSGQGEGRWSFFVRAGNLRKRVDVRQA